MHNRPYFYLLIRFSFGLLALFDCNIADNSLKRVSLLESLWFAHIRIWIDLVDPVRRCDALRFNDVCQPRHLAYLARLRLVWVS